ncbi:hypothetical protein J6TS7_20680 [Paenibacillus dendritiformis]|uniref:hypothetical protein n=1 Tax=Paenibacillus TaxID=44249 RepID=UPI001B1BC6CD|nr:hypothetical protein [Paenibacillus dendritiformis]GIO78458.1 hypothetical protein J6TS7_20680 [Paenibacillus dendritiformis]
MIKYEVGTLFPHPNLKKGMDNCRTQIVGSSFDVLCYITNPTNKDRKVFKDALLRFHVWVYQHIPFMAVSYLGSNWTYDFTLTVVGGSNVESSFFEPGNAVTLFLVDAKTNIMQAGRLIGLPEEAEKLIKDACSEQLKVYKDRKEIDAVIASVYNGMSTDEIIQRGTRVEFKRN